MNLSHLAIQDLRLAIQKSYGDTFDSNLSDEEVIEIGMLLLNILAESLIIKTSHL